MTPATPTPTLRFTRTGRISKAGKGQRVHCCDRCSNVSRRGDVVEARAHRWTMGPWLIGRSELYARGTPAVSSSIRASRPSTDVPSRHYRKHMPPNDSTASQTNPAPQQQPPPSPQAPPTRAIEETEKPPLPPAEVIRTIEAPPLDPSTFIFPFDFSLPATYTRLTPVSLPPRPTATPRPAPPTSHLFAHPLTPSPDPAYHNHPHHHHQPQHAGYVDPRILASPRAMCVVPARAAGSAPAPCEARRRRPHGGG